MTEPILWQQLHWPRPLDQDHILSLLRRLAAHPNRRPVTFEARGRDGRISYWLGSEPSSSREVSRLLEELVPGTLLARPAERRFNVNRSDYLLIRRDQLSLDAATPQTSIRPLLEALASARGSQGTVLQVVLGPGIAPKLLPAKVDDPNSSWLDLLLRGHKPATPQAKSSMQAKLSQFGFQSVVRIGVVAHTDPERIVLIRSLRSGLNTLRSAGTTLRFVKDREGSLDSARVPAWWPNRLSLTEITTLLVVPLGDSGLPGVPSGHPKPLRPPAGYREPRDSFAVATAPGTTVRLGADIKDRLYHSVFLGGTGSGKSTAMLHLIRADVNAGRAVVVIDPKADLISDVLTHIPAHRRDDVVVLDPTQESPVGLNPLITPGSNAELTADGILAIFKELFASAFGPRTTDIMHAGLLTLSHHGKASLVWLPRLLTDPAFRRRLTRSLNDPVGLEPFWAQFDALSPGQQALAIAPGMSRLRQLLLRPSLRAVLGQIEPKFHLQELFTKRRILLVALNKGVLGPEAARLLGSLIVSQLWQLTLARATTSQNQRQPVSVYVDEAQDYLHLSTDIADALSQSRSLGVAWHLAHQYRSQMPSDVNAGIDTNARNAIVFGLDAADAASMAKRAPELEPVDFQSLGQFEIYTRLMNEGRSTGWISGKTVPLPEPISSERDLRDHSQNRFGGKPSLAELGIDETTDLDEPLGRIAREPAV